MVVFPNAKINIGLNIISKRPDGYRNIETVFYPIKLCDVLELHRAEDYKIRIRVSGNESEIPAKKNIVYKAYKALQHDFKLPGADIYLQKNIPQAAGLGGGSSDAAFLLKAANELFELKLSEARLENYASALGSDCAFFIKNRLCLAKERGNIFSEIAPVLESYYLLLIKPDFGINTAEAYSKVTPVRPSRSLSSLIAMPPEVWSNFIKNDFEDKIFRQHPVLGNIKRKLYETGAVYAAMSGSGSSMYGIFREKPEIPDDYQKYFTFISKLSPEI